MRSNALLYVMGGSNGYDLISFYRNRLGRRHFRIGCPDSSVEQNDVSLLQVYIRRVIVITVTTDPKGSDEANCQKNGIEGMTSQQNPFHHVSPLTKKWMKQEQRSLQGTRARGIIIATTTTF
jgi:hypothetical protein